MPSATNPSPNALGRINPDTGRFYWNFPTTVLFAAIGALPGFMTGLLGVGGGFVIVPLLQRYADLSMHGVVATTLLLGRQLGHRWLERHVQRGFAAVLFGVACWLFAKAALPA